MFFYTITPRSFQNTDCVCVCEGNASDKGFVSLYGWNIRMESTILDIVLYSDILFNSGFVKIEQMYIIWYS